MDGFMNLFYTITLVAGIIEGKQKSQVLIKAIAKS